MFFFSLTHKHPGLYKGAFGLRTAVIGIQPNDHILIHEPQIQTADIQPLNIADAAAADCSGDVDEGCKLGFFIGFLSVNLDLFVQHFTQGGFTGQHTQDAYIR